MAEFARVEWKNYITVPSLTQRSRLEELLRKEGVVFKVERGRVYTDRRPGVANETLKAMGVKIHSIKQASNRPALPAMTCRYGQGCTFSTDDIEEWADHVRVHFPESYSYKPPAQEPIGSAEAQNHKAREKEGREMVEATTTGEKSTTTAKGYRKGKLTQEELARMQTMLEEGATEVEVARVLHRRLAAVQRRARQLQAPASELPSQPASDNGRHGKNGLNGPVTSGYTVIGLFRKAQREAAALQETLAELTQVVGPWLEAQDRLLNQPANRDWR